MLLAGALVFAGCGGTEQQSEESAQPAPTPELTATAKPKPSCKRASKALLAAIEAGLQVNGGGKLHRGFIVHSKDFEKVYVVAADIQGDGLEGSGDVGVWATNSPSGAGSIFAVDSVAQEFSDWGDADKTDAELDQSADGVAGPRLRGWLTLTQVSRSK